MRLRLSTFTTTSKTDFSPSYRYFEQEGKKKKDGEKQIEVEEQVGLKKFIKVNDMRKVKIRFSDLPISKYTSQGLAKAKYVKLTEVQR